MKYEEIDEIYFYYHEINLPQKPTSSFVISLVMYIIKTSRRFVYIIGTKRYQDNMLQNERADFRGSFITEWFEVAHGDVFYTNVKCVNNIGLSSVEVFGPIKVSLNKPFIDNAWLKFIQRSQRTTEALSSMEPNAELQMAKQSTFDHIQFAWDGFLDVSGISRFEYRLVVENEPLTDWTDAGLKDVISVNVSFSDGAKYTVEVSAVNIANLRSILINSSLLVDGRKPELTGIFFSYLVFNQLQYVTNGLSNPYQLGESTFIFRGIRCKISFLFIFR